MSQEQVEWPRCLVRSSDQAVRLTALLQAGAGGIRLILLEKSTPEVKPIQSRIRREKLASSHRRTVTIHHLVTVPIFRMTKAALHSKSASIVSTEAGGFRVTFKQCWDFPDVYISAA